MDPALSWLILHLVSWTGLVLLLWRLEADPWVRAHGMVVGLLLAPVILATLAVVWLLAELDGRGDA